MALQTIQSKYGQLKHLIVSKHLWGHQGVVFSLKSLPLNKIASGSYKDIKIWDMESGVCLQTLNGHLHWVVCLICLPNGHLVSGSRDRSRKVWDLDRGECIQTLTGHSGFIWCLVLLINGHVASGSENGTIKIWNMHNRQCINTCLLYTSPSPRDS